MNNKYFQALQLQWIWVKVEKTQLKRKEKEVKVNFESNFLIEFHKKELAHIILYISNNFYSSNVAFKNKY